MPGRPQSSVESDHFRRTPRCCFVAGGDREDEEPRNAWRQSVLRGYQDLRRERFAIDCTKCVKDGWFGTSKMQEDYPSAFSCHSRCRLRRVAPLLFLCRERRRFYGVPRYQPQPRYQLHHIQQRRASALLVLEISFYAVTPIP